MPKQLTDFESVELGGNIYMIGGREKINGVATWIKDVYAYNIQNKTWVKKADLPSTYSNYSVVSLYGKIYLISGTTLLEYNPQLNTWSSISSIPSASYDAAVLNGKIYILSASRQLNIYDPVNNSWKTGLTISESASIYDVQALGDYIYVFGYYSGYKIYQYNPVNNTWKTNTVDYHGQHYAPIYNNFYFLQTAGGEQPVTRYYPEDNVCTYYTNYFHDYEKIHSICTANNKVYIFAGNNDGAQAIVEYMPAVSPWLQKAYPSFMTEDMGFGVINNKLYTVGGKGYLSVDGSDQYLKALFEYNPVSNTWSEKTGMITARSRPASAVVNNKLYVIAGQINTSGSATNKVEEYNPSTNSWATKADYPYSLHSAAAASYSNKIYVFGGKSGSSVRNYVREYDPSTNVWTSKTNMPTARYGAGAVEYKGKIYVIGGFNSSGTALKTVEVYNPSANTWSTTEADLPVGRGYAGIVADDCIYVINGSDGVIGTNTVYQYNPNVNKWFSWVGTDYAASGLVAVALNKGIYTVNGFTSDGVYFASCKYVPTSSIASDYSELIHLGSDTVNLSGNLSRTYTDLSFNSPGFSVNVSRTYNSKDDRTSLISPGWSFGFQGKIEELGNDMVIRLPNGSAMTFKTNSNGTYAANDSRSTLVKSGSTHIMTTSDNYKYGFNSSGYLDYMQDPNGNKITITVNSSGQVTKVADQVGRSITVNYTSNRISSISDPAGRVVYYYYDTSNRLNQVMDANSNNTYYTYDANGLLNSIKDHNSVVTESFTYAKAEGDTDYKVKTITYPEGYTETYAYDKFDGKVTVSSTGRTTVTYYDKWLYPISTIDAEGKESRTEYNLDNGINRYGEISSYLDRNGNLTTYDRDTRGNIIRIINPDRSTKEYTYNTKNNVLSEKDEMGKMTYYVYDSAGINLTKKAQPLNGTDVYSTSAVQSNFAITNYAYYTSTGAFSGKTMYGMLQTETDPMGGVTTYTYDTYGNLATAKNPLNRITTYSYNTIGWLKQSKTPMGYIANYYYDKNGLLLKKVSGHNLNQTSFSDSDSDIERYYYDFRGNLLCKVEPLQYLSSYDTTTFSTENIISNTVNTYSQAGHGYRYVYNTKGQLTSVTDPQNYLTSYTYDTYGNVLTKTNPNQSGYQYTYDKINRLTLEAFRDTSSASYITLHQYVYSILSNGNTTKAERKYVSSASYVATTTTYDYAGREIKIQYPNSSYDQLTYNANGTLASERDPNGYITYHQYDGMNRKTGTWKPVSASQFSYTGLEYDKNNRIVKENASRTLVANGAVPGSLTWKQYAYNSDGTVSAITTSNNGKSTYAYDTDGNNTSRNLYTTSSAYQYKSFTYNHRNQVVNENQQVQYGDISGQAYTINLTLTTSHTYDKNGNLLTITNSHTYYQSGNTLTIINQDSSKYTYVYDLLNRKTSEKVELGSSSSTTGYAYDWRNNLTSKTDARGKVTTYTYTPRGFLEKETDALSQTTYYTYDQAGRMTAKVSPRYYVANAALTTMNRTEYVYDNMSRLTQEKQVYTDGSNTKTVVSITNTYANNGNLTKQVDALGYSTLYEYDRSNQLTKIRDAEAQSRGLAQTKLMTYDGLGHLITGKDANNIQTTYTYNDDGKVLTKTVAGVRMETNTYD